MARGGHTAQSRGREKSRRGLPPAGSGLPCSFGLPRKVPGLLLCAVCFPVWELAEPRVLAPDPRLWAEEAAQGRVPVCAQRFSVPFCCPLGAWRPGSLLSWVWAGVLIMLLKGWLFCMRVWWSVEMESPLGVRSQLFTLCLCVM